ncbi:pentachlorophenol 4-monooxygenase [Crassisporium funariophilum]|nr:pentachlorophenol 4-monooxygenase [Crassisporium funariophilum]
MNSTASHPKVLIVGGGPAGLILALSLLQNGVPVRIIEKNAQPRLGQRGAGIMPRSLELFSYLRLIDEVMKLAIVTPPVRMYKLPDGTNPVHEFEMSPYRDPTPTDPFLSPVMLGQDRLEKIFYAALAKHSCFVELGTELKSFEQSHDHVKVNLIRRGMSEEEDSGIPEVAIYDWMIGADGARGVVRKQLGLSFLGETRKVENFIVGDVIVEGLAQKFWHMWGDLSNVMISLRGTETDQLFNLFIGGKNVNHPIITASDEALLKCLADNTGQRPDLNFKKVAWVSHYSPNIRMVQNFGHGRVYVAGDAGHVHSPTGGQGMNSSIQDSFNLGWKLALVAKGFAGPSLLQTYTEERIPVIKDLIQQTTTILNETLNNSSEGAIKRGMGHIQLGENYRGSSIVVDERKAIDAEREAEEDAYLRDYSFGEENDVDNDVDFDERLRAGDRAPDSSGLVVRSPPHLLNRACQLFQIFGSSYHVVLIFAGLANCKAVLATLAAYPKELVRSVVVIRCHEPISANVACADFVLEDRDGHAYGAYCLSGVCGIIVVRPDGKVGAIVKGSLGLHRYFHLIFKTN